MSPLRRRRNSFRSDYVFSVEGQVICIVDLDRGNCSVISDIENVLDDIALLVGGLSGYAVIYQANTGWWNGVRLTEDGEVKLYTLGEIDKDKAKDRLLHISP